MCQTRTLSFQRERALALIHESAWFRRASEALLVEIADLAELAVVPKGDYLYHSGDPIEHLILPVAGNAQILLDTPTNAQLLFAYVTPREWLGEAAIKDGSRHRLSIYCNEEFTGFFFEAHAFSQVLRRHPEIYEDILVCEVERRKNIFELISSRLPVNVEKRLALRIVQIARSHCGADSNHGTLPPSINQVEIARSVMTSRQTVNRIFGAWTQQGIAQRVGPNFMFDLGQLEQQIIADI